MKQGLQVNRYRPLHNEAHCIMIDMEGFQILALCVRWLPL